MNFRANWQNAAIYIFLVLLAVLMILAAAGYFIGAWD